MTLMALYGLRTLIMTYGFLDVVASRLHDVVTYDKDRRSAIQLSPCQPKGWRHRVLVQYRACTASLCQDTQEHVLINNL